MPAFETSIYADRFHETYRWFEAKINQRNWLQVTRTIRSRIAGEPVLKDYLEQEYAVPFQLELLSRATTNSGFLNLNRVPLQSVHEAMALISQTASMMRHFPQQEHAIKRRFISALRDPNAMRGLTLELTVATHFVVREHQLVWPEMEGHTPSPDMVVTSIGPAGLEVECKSIGPDTGHKIDPEPAKILLDRIHSSIAPMARQASQCLSMMIIFPTTITPDREKLAELAGFSTSCLLRGEGRFSGPDDVEVHLKPVPGGPTWPQVNSLNEDERTDLICSITGKQSANTLIIGNSGEGLVIVSVHSRRETDIVTPIYETVARAAKRQLSKQRPGMIFVGLHGVKDHQMQMLADIDRTRNLPPTVLGNIVSKLLGSPSRQHLIGLAFVSRTSLYSVARGVHSPRGVSYTFYNENSPYWHQDLKAPFA